MYVRSQDANNLAAIQQDIPGTLARWRRTNPQQTPYITDVGINGLLRISMGRYTAASVLDPLVQRGHLERITGDDGGYEYRLPAHRGVNRGVNRGVRNVWGY